MLPICFFSVRFVADSRCRPGRRAGNPRTRELLAPLSYHVVVGVISKADYCILHTLNEKTYGKTNAERLWCGNARLQYRCLRGME